MESNQERLIRYVEDCWAVEKALVPMLRDMADEVDDPTIATMFRQHADLTWRQEENLEARLRALGAEPSGVKGFFHQLAAKMGDAIDAGHNTYDKNTQNLMKAYATEHFEMAMYQALEAFATTLGDAETARLAREHLEQERQTAELIWPQIAPTSSKSVHQPGVQRSAA